LIYPWLLSANGGLFFSLIWFRGSGLRGSPFWVQGSEVLGSEVQLLALSLELISLPAIMFFLRPGRLGEKKLNEKS
jgi:hypothetical protein